MNRWFFSIYIVLLTSEKGNADCTDYNMYINLMLVYEKKLFFKHCHAMIPVRMHLYTANVSLSVANFSDNIHVFLISTWTHELWKTKRSTGLNGHLWPLSWLLVRDANVCILTDPS